MISPLQPYVDFILTQRDWSWTLVGVMYLLAAGLVRSWLLSPVTAQLKTLESSLQRKVEFAYLKESILGWIFFFIPLGLIILVWRGEILRVRITHQAAVLTGTGSLVLSIFLHLAAYGRGAISILKAADEERHKI